MLHTSSIHFKQVNISTRCFLPSKMDASNFPALKDGTVYLSNKDKSYRVVVGYAPGPEVPSQPENKRNIEEYKWRDGDFLQITFPKCGTHLGWEVMSMLLNGSADYIDHSMAYALIDLTRPEIINERNPSPRVLNTHYRLDLLPDEFQNKKTICVIRNPKDAAVSFYFFLKHVFYPVHGLDPDVLMFENFLDEFLDINRDTVMWGNYFEHVEFMWELSKTRPDMLVIFYEGLVRNPVENVKKLNEFMGTGHDDELIQKIAESLEFKKMKKGKHVTELEVIPDYTAEDSSLAADSSCNKVGDDVTVFRKGEIGDWKNWFTVAMNDKFDKHLKAWKPAQEIPLIYE